MTNEVERVVMFPMTQDGYRAAKSYLIAISKYDEFMNNKTSLDGFSLVAFANSILTGEHNMIYTPKLTDNIPVC